jgi:hypothetical protein
MLVVLRSFGYSVDGQFSKVKNALANEKIRTPKRPERLYQLLYGRISVKAIQLTKSTYDRFLLVGDDKSEIPLLCNCNSKQTSGFLCIHIIKTIDDREGRLESDLYHAQWHLYSVNDAPPINPLLLI